MNTEIEMNEPKSKELEAAIQAVKKGASVALNYYNHGLAFEHKEDNSIITQADLEVEEIIKNTIAETFPDAAFLAEESEGDRTLPNLWVIDPIDSTRSFSRRIPTWDIMIGYQKDGTPQLGVSYFPTLDMLYYAEKGKGAFCNGKPIHVSDTPDLSHSLVGHGSANRFKDKQLLVDLFNASESTRSADPIFTSSLIAQGSMEGLIDAYGMPWDFAPWKVIIEEAGGMITKLNGEPWVVDESKGCVLSNGKIHEELLAIAKKYY